VIEVTSGLKISAKRSQKGVASLALAQGAIYAAALVKGLPVHPINEQQWTERKPKRDRARIICLTETLYARVAASDSGLDAADAIGLGRWWIATEAMRKLLKEAK
jgi:hypothetical protein